MAAAVKWLVPPLDDRITITRENAFAVLVLPLVPFLLLCYLVRQPHTRLLRAAVLPVALVANLRASFGYIARGSGSLAHNNTRGEAQSLSMLS